jgi:hypothetical protein
MIGCPPSDAGPPDPAPMRGAGGGAWDDVDPMNPILVRMAGRGHGRLDCFTGGGTVV